MANARIGYETNSDTLKAKDFQVGQTWPMRISRVEQRELADRKDESKTIHRNVIFAKGKDGSEKGIVLNYDNNEMMCELYGDETDDWINQVVKIKIVSTPFGNGFKILPNAEQPKHEPAKPAAKSTKHALAEDLTRDLPGGDDIPF